jgi:hypothetical protein
MYDNYGRTSGPSFSHCSRSFFHHRKLIWLPTLGHYFTNGVAIFHLHLYKNNKGTRKGVTYEQENCFAVSAKQDTQREDSRGKEVRGKEKYIKRK